MTDRVEADAIIAVAQDIHALTVMAEPDGVKGSRQWLAVKDGWKMQDVTEPAERPAPKFLNQSVTLATEDALVDYVNRFKTSATMLFANVNANCIQAVLDYHRASLGGLPTGPVTQADPGVTMPPEVAAVADRLGHHATLELVLAEEWTAWTENDGKMLGQLAYARFLEENLDDIRNPDGATVLELVRTLQVTKNYTFKGSVRTDSNHEDIAYQEVTASGAGRDGSMPVPVYVDLLLPVFLGGTAHGIRAFIRHQQDGKLTIGHKLKGAAKVKQDAFMAIAEGVRSRVNCPMVMGALD